MDENRTPLNILVTPPSNRKLFTSGAAMLFIKVGGLFLQLASGVVLARILGAAHFGIYSFCMAVVRILTIPAVLGLPQLLVKQTAIYHSRNEYGLLSGLFRRTNQGVLLLSLVLAGGGLALGWFFLRDGREGMLAAFCYAMALLPLLSLSQVRLGILRGLRKVIHGFWPDTVLRPAVFIAAVLLWTFVLESSVRPQDAVLFQVGASAVAFLCGVLLLFRFLPKEVKQAEPSYRVKEWLRSAVPFLFLGAVQIINKETDIVMLGFFRSPAEVGVYRAAVQGAAIVVFIKASSSLIIAPEIARLYAAGKKDEVQRVVTFTARVTVAATIPVVVFLVVFGRWALGFFFGGEFEAGTTALRILTAVQFLNVGVGVVGVILNMTGHQNYSLRGFAVGAVSNVILNLLLIPRFGIEGAAAATTISLCIWNGLLLFWVRKKTGIRSSIW